MDAILPGATLGVLGAGQIGRMFALTAKRMGYRVAVLGPERDAPAAQVADQVVVGAYDDERAVEELARAVAVCTFEFENVPAAVTAAAARHTLVRPNGNLLHVAQNRRREKDTLRELGLPVCAYAAIEAEADLARAAEACPGPAILKTASSGYDGKGQVAIDGPAQLAEAWRSIGRAPAVLEARVSFVREISVVGARGLDGRFAAFAPFENRHANHVLDVTTTPARSSAATQASAIEMTRRLLEGLDVHGVVCVELFELADGALWINEIAPRPHNSGHLTIDGHVTSQFEQQVRAICGLPLGSVEHAPGVALANLLGDLWQHGEPDWAAALAVEGVRLHLYGKAEARPGRKMGHLTATAGDVDEAERRVLAARAALVPSGAGGPRAQGRD